jgi:tRNA-dihydrouridine synthase
LWKKPPPKSNAQNTRSFALAAHCPTASHRIVWRCPPGWAKILLRVTPSESFARLLQGTTPLLALAPMQDVTTLEFMHVIARHGGPDIYWTEYFRVHGDSRPEKWILASILHNPTRKPIVAQMIGNDIPALVRTAKLLQKLPVAAIDLNLGCPAPIVYRKCAGGGLLRDPQKIDAIIGALREAVQIPFTVKTRIGFDSPAEFDRLLPVFARHPLDLLTIHARTVKQMYRPSVRYHLIAQAVAELKCPVLANGNIHSPGQARDVLAATHARGLMIGRGAIRNPWLFEQIRSELHGRPVRLPTGREVLAYLHELWDQEITPGVREAAQVQRMKKFANFIGEGVGPEFLFAIRRAATTANFWDVAKTCLDHDQPMALQPTEPQTDESSNPTAP